MPKSTLLYQPLDFAMVRAPLLPIEAFLALQTPPDQLALMKDPRVERAVAAGSISLSNALRRFEKSAMGRKDEDKLMAKLLRYQIRMSTRPTPFGLFAGCATVPFGETTDLKLLNTFGASHTRPDMSWLMDFVVTAESNPSIRRKLRLKANPLVRIEGGRLHLATRMPGRKADKVQPVSVRATRVAMEALDLAKDVIDYADLAARLLAASPAATPEKVDRLLDDLLDQTFLLTSLRPPLTSASPAQYVLERLAEIPEATAPHQTLHAFLQAACRWDRAPHPESLDAFHTVLHAAGFTEEKSKDAFCQVDLALAVEGRIGSFVAQEAARAAELLLRLSSSPAGLGSIAAYRNAFLNRYGGDREVPVLELLDPAQGLGPVSSHGYANTGPAPAVAAKRSRILLALACSALHQRQTVLHLDDATLRDLETSTVTAQTAPISLDINLMVGAASAAAIDEGKFTVVIGPNLGAWAACRNFGRFAHFEPPSDAPSPIQRAAALEQTNHFPDHLWAEVAYLPAHIRGANVAVRPAIRQHEVVVGVAPGVADTAVLPLEDLVAGVAGNRFYVRSQKHGRKIRFVSGHMLNHNGAPPVVQFLLDIAQDGVTTFTSFDWGPAEPFPFLPRVQSGRIVLRPAEWKLTKEENFAKWREDWQPPRYVCLAAGDNRLILDLDCPSHQQQIQTELARLPESHSLLLQEVLPTLDDAWLQNAEGRYYSEFIVPLLLKPAKTEAPANTAIESRPAAPAALRLRPPGTDWLYAKLYCPIRSEDELIAERLLPMAENAVASGLAASWFFIRYADPEPHLRLRFHGETTGLSTHLFSQIGQWAEAMMQDGICTRIVFDTYDREIERFGGPEGMAIAEQIFHADSRAAAALVKVLRSKDWEDQDRRLALFALTVDDLARVCNFSDAERLAWYKEHAGATNPAAGNEYRRMKNLLRAAIGNPAGWLAEMPHGEAIQTAFRRRAEDLAEPAERLRDTTLWHSPAKLFASYSHLHLNRIGAAPYEGLLLNLLHRTRAGLTKSQ